MILFLFYYIFYLFFCYEPTSPRSTLVQLRLSSPVPLLFTSIFLIKKCGSHKKVILKGTAFDTVPFFFHFLFDFLCYGLTSPRSTLVQLRLNSPVPLLFTSIFLIKMCRAHKKEGTVFIVPSFILVFYYSYSSYYRNFFCVSRRCVIHTQYHKYHEKQITKRK